MGPTFCGLLLVLPLAVATSSGEILLENRGPHPLVYEARHSGQGTWSEPLTLAAGKEHSYSASSCLVIRFPSGEGRTTAVLAPGRRFRYQLDSAGRGEIVGDGADEAGRPKTREINVLAVADETYRRKYSDWEDRIAEIVATTSNYFDDAFAIRLRLSKCRPWEYEAAAAADPEEQLGRLLGVDSPHAEIVIGWIAVAQAAPGQPGWYAHSWSWPFGSHILIADLEKRLVYGAAEQLVQRLAVTFGAFYVVDRGSIMQKILDNVPYPLQFDDTTRQVILLSREFDFHLGVRSLRPQEARRIRELYRTHHHPDDSPNEDPISRAYRAPRRPQEPRKA